MIWPGEEPGIISVRLKGDGIIIMPDLPAVFEADRARAEKAVDVEKRTAFGSVGAFASELNFLT
jgi:hypothetical protein